jgi:3-hydroxyisobutyrate dehydrogenase-like beta-hydroxyacid dehydrogenase
MTTPEPVTVIGLGAMGAALAHGFLTAGHPTTVWNRTPGRADDLVAAGAREADSVDAAVRASGLTVVCVLDRPAVDAVLDAVGEQTLRGRTIVNLTSSVPEDARAVAERVTAAGGRHLDGKILVPTPLVGTDDGLVLYAGDRSVFDDHVGTLRALGPDADHLGADPGLAATFDLGMLDVFFSGVVAFLHASALVGVDGVAAKTFLPYAERVVDVLKVSMASAAADVDAGTYPGHEDNLEMDARALDHIVETSAARGVDTRVPALAQALAREAIAAGHGRDGFSRVVDVLRRPTSET